ncbi:DUF6114 domain-containing protein [Microbacterium sp. BWT-B31]|uniref:DUF6114 domain-containing protein n=1 Tax=Microbacterium sp. BWT-B31 TaxID=3232072 RepID=UPI0035290E1F
MSVTPDASGARASEHAMRAARAASAAPVASATDAHQPAAPGRLRRWSADRPFVGGVLIALAGIEVFLSSQLDLGNIRVQLGIEGLQATIIPIALVLLGVLIIAMPVHRIFYGVLALAVAVYSLVGVNLGGFFVGMMLGCVGGILAVAWLPTDARTPRTRVRRRASAEGLHDGDPGVAP